MQKKLCLLMMVGLKFGSACRMSCASPKHEPSLSALHLVPVVSSYASRVSVEQVPVLEYQYKLTKNDMCP